MAVDLHIHSNISDGIYSPTELVSMAKEKGISIMALTDHDSVQGVPPALEAGEQLGVHVIPGLELSTDVKDIEIHILGYYIDLASPRLHRTLDILKSRRRERCFEILNNLCTLGIDIPFEYVLSLGREGFTGRSQIFKAMVNLGFASPSRKDGDFQKYLGKGGLAYVEHGGLNPKDAIELIRKCKGIPILAHPRAETQPSTVKDLIDVGLEGIEAYHPSHSKGTTRYWLQFAEKYDLVVTGGSDFHKNEPGGLHNLGSLNLPDYIALDLTKRWLEISPP